MLLKPLRVKRFHTFSPTLPGLFIAAGVFALHPNLRHRAGKAENIAQHVREVWDAMARGQANLPKYTQSASNQERLPQ